MIFLAFLSPQDDELFGIWQHHEPCAEAVSMLIDTDIIIWFMRGNHRAKQLIQNHPGFQISVVSYMELVEGMRDKAELRILHRALRS